jgi:hypothetical protein
VGNNAAVAQSCTEPAAINWRNGDFGLRGGARPFAVHLLPPKRQRSIFRDKWIYRE